MPSGKCPLHKTCPLSTSKPHSGPEIPVYKAVRLSRLTVSDRPSDLSPGVGQQMDDCPTGDAFTIYYNMQIVNCYCCCHTNCVACPVRNVIHSRWQHCSIPIVSRVFKLSAVVYSCKSECVKVTFEAIFRTRKISTYGLSSTCANGNTAKKEKQQHTNPSIYSAKWK